MKSSEFQRPDRTRSILEEITRFSPQTELEELLDARANHIIQSAIYLFEQIDNGFDTETSAALKRKFVNSINSGDPRKFSRVVTRLKEERDSGTRS